MPKFGTTIRELRKARGWSQKELGRRASISNSAVSKIESGQLVPTTETRESIAAALGTAVDVAFVGFPPAKSEMKREQRAELRARIVELYDQGKSDKAVGAELGVAHGTVSNNRRAAGHPGRPNLVTFDRRGKVTVTEFLRKHPEVSFDHTTIREAINAGRLSGKKITAPAGDYEFVYLVAEQTLLDELAALPECRLEGCHRLALAGSGACGGPHTRALEARGPWWQSEEGEVFRRDYGSGKLRPACWLCGTEKAGLAPAFAARAWREGRRHVCRTCGPLWIAALASARDRARLAPTNMAALEAVVGVAAQFERDLRERLPSRRGQPRHLASDLAIEALGLGRRLSHAEVAGLLTRGVVRGLLPAFGDSSQVSRDYVKTRARRAKIKRRLGAHGEY